jgi:hypothetical protein
VTRIFERRLRRLEQATGAPDDDELVEVGLSDQGKTMLRETLISLGTMTLEEIEATVNKRQLLPRSCRLELSPAGRAQLEETLAMMEQRRPQGQQQ